MNYTVSGDCVVLSGIADFSPEAIFECGQCFRWNADENGVYSGVAFGKQLEIWRAGDDVALKTTERDFKEVWQGYFDLGTDYAGIRRHVSINEHMEKAARFGAGIRILRQERWEALCSFIISQCNNIPRIKKIVETLCSLFGEEISPGRFAFPGAEKIASLTEERLSPLRAGYRAKYILEAARAVSSGDIDLRALSEAPGEEALRKLKALPGVGDKVASCVMLFGLGQLDAFPIDVWVKKALRARFDSDFDPCVFSPYAGVAQQYIFYYERNRDGK
ncbi:MAG: DNA-3-methyladenine glycosylase 2 family protein [Clostridiales bacterium]|nr:DNA-3-methyladenine glycosylase 2 family protein [Clostridiales bacterium]